jgi:pimeloyl-ACP methyl ester carboxylesterase
VKTLKDLLPHFRIVTLRNSGHFGHIEEPNEFAAAVAAFVTGAALR